MSNEHESVGMLAGTRVLDMTDEGGAICAKILADLGADVIKVEPPDGCTTRSIPPFLGGVAGPDRGAYTIAYHGGKRSVTLDLHAADSAERLRMLARDADFLIESMPAGHFESAGVTLDELRALNPRLVTASITSFGDRGPSASSPASDITTWASSGMMHLSGAPGRAPLRISVPQSGLHAGAEAAVACLIAHLARLESGVGQHLAVSAQAACLVTMLNAQAFPVLHGGQLERTGLFVGGGDIAKQAVFECKDGFVSTVLTGGTATHAVATKRLVEWMDEEGWALDWMNDVDWSTWSPASLMADTSAAFLDRVKEAEAQLETFFRQHTRAEIYQQSLRRELLVAPVATVEDIAHDAQLEAREYFHEVTVPAASTALSLPGPFAKMSVTPLAPPRPAPTVGQHDDEIWATTGAARTTPAVAPKAGSRPAAKPALAGLKVLDFTWFGVGPLTTKYLADNGADVVKVESRRRLDGLRMSPPWVGAKPDPNNSQAFNDFNSSKRSITVDLATEQGRDLIRSLVPHFDVVTESFTPGTIARMGLGYEDLRALRPDLVMLSTCMQGQYGPHADYPGFGNLMASLCGFYYVSGYSPHDLAPPYGAYTDMIAHRFAACALLGAIAHRAQTGEGQYIDVSQYEASLHFLAPPLVHYMADGVVAGPHGNRSPLHAPHGAYRCLDDDGDERWIAIAVATDEQWHAMVAALAPDDAPDLDRFRTHAQRLAAADELDELVQSWTMQRNADDIAAALDARGVPAYPVRDALHLHTDENLLAFDFWRWMGPDDGEVTPYQGPAYRLDGTPSQQTIAPRLGEHTREVLSGYLGLDDAAIDRLHESGVCA